ncbi:SCAN domain-containing protein 3-like [Pseudoliparis swirei]|uniref:SCAN domain-containing protein 3-like n=1 Tax=Pseudoliparis swirei TaxID=2059687 RepID=UPI0024BEFF2D|nr:SCAN domain-containing protein 3-like [Pseudoliparis swirei]
MSNKPMCLLCSESIAVMKEYNVKRHYKSNHGSFSNNFPEGSDERRRKVNRLLACFQRGQCTLSRFCTEQERAMIAYIRVAWTLARQKRPFTESETVKDGMLAVIDEMIVDEKVKASVTSSIKKVPLSDTSTLRRLELLATDVEGKLLENLRKAEFMSLAVDESTDCTDMAQLCIYVRFYDGVRVREELLGLVPLEGHTTDGAPALTSRVKGLVAGLAAVAPHMQFLHRIIHQAVLCAKLSGDLKNNMDTVNFIRSTSSLRHRLFRMLLADASAEHTDSLVHRDVRWLSKGKVLERFCELRREILSFLRTCKHFLERMLDEQFMAEVHFLCDIFGHLNTLNLEVQGREKSIADLVERLCAFKTKLTIFTEGCCTSHNSVHS